METKIVYALVSDEDDYYYEMVQLSVYSFRLFHPKDQVELVMDRDTYSRLNNKPKSILNDVSAHSIDTPLGYNKFQRSRFIKTNLRRIIKGRFLFLDCDTLICGPLDAIDQIQEDVAFAFHNDGAILKNRKVMEKAGFPVPKGDPKINYNGGVFFANDTPSAYTFFDMWFELWKQSNLTATNPDQPALFQTILNLHYPQKEIEGGGIWNCQILTEFSRPFLKDAVIYHYYANIKSVLRSLIWKHLRNTNEMDAFIEEIIRNPKSIGYFFFTMTDDRLRFIQESGLIFEYENNPIGYRLFVPFLRSLSKPIRRLSRIKKRLS